MRKLLPATLALFVSLNFSAARGGPLEIPRTPTSDLEITRFRATEDAANSRASRQPPLTGLAGNKIPGAIGPVTATDFPINGQFIVDSTSNPGGKTSLAAGDTLEVNGGDTFVGFGNTGTFTQSGGTFTADSTANFQIGSASTATGTYNLQGGTLSTGVVYIGNDGLGTVNQTGGTFNTNGKALTLGNGLPGGGIYTLGGATSSLSTGTVIIGKSGGGSFTQNAGTFTTNGNAFTVGSTKDGSGGYTLNGGSLSTGAVTIADTSLSAAFAQAGGTLTTNGNSFVVGNGSGSIGTFNLTGGGITAGATLFGIDGTATATQSGGTFTVPTGVNVFQLGLDATGKGTYTLSGTGSVSVQTVRIGVAGNGTFNQTGGTFTTNGQSFTVGNSTGGVGAYNLSNSTGTGSLTTGAAVIGSQGKGTFTQTSGTFSTGTAAFTVGSLAGGTGTYNLSGTAATTLTTGITIIGDAGNGTFNQSGGAFTTSGQPFSVGNSQGGVGDYEMTGGSFTAGSNTFLLGADGNGTVTDSAGTFTVGLFRAGLDATGSATFNLRGTGSLSTQGAVIGSAGLAVFNQSGGTYTTNGQTLVVGNGGGGANSGGSYKLSSTGSLSTGAATIGNAGSGVFMQSGGTFTTNSNTLQIGNSTTGAGSYTLSGGTLTTGSATIGISGTGTFTQSAGTFSTGTSPLHLAENTNSTGNYNLQGGSLSTGTALIGNGGNSTFTQTGGTFSTSSGAVFGLGFSSTGTGLYNLSGVNSNVNVSGAAIGFDGTGVVTQTGGFFNNTGVLTLAVDAGSVGTYVLAGGALSTGSVTGGGGTSRLDFNGGTLVPTGSSTTFLQGLTKADILAGGATVDLEGVNVTIAQALVTGTAAGVPDGGLTKIGTANVLTLSGNNTYTGPTTVSAGTLQAGGISSFGVNSAVTLANVAGATLDLNNFAEQIGSLTGGGTTGGNVTLGAATLAVGGDNTSPAAYAGTISGTGALIKFGTGTLTLSGANTYTGTTSVNTGTLKVNGSIASTAGVTVASGAKLAGIGTLSGPISVNAGATFEPGDIGVGKMTLTGTLTLASTATDNFTLSATATNTKVLVGGQLTVGGNLILALASGFTPAINSTFYLLDQTGTSASVLGLFANAPGGVVTINGAKYQINYATHDPSDTSNALNNDVSATYLGVVPEPSTWALVIFILTAAAVLNRRQKPSQRRS